MDQDLDRIEREITISAPIQRVWSLVTQPGWWVAETGEVDLVEGALVVPEHPEHGKYPVRIERIQPQTYVAYRWASTFPGQEPDEDNSTLVEFNLDPVAEGTRLRVVESGFTKLAASNETRINSVRDNIEGWDHQLAALRELATQPVGS